MKPNHYCRETLSRRRARRAAAAALVSTTALLASCHASFSERHYFASRDTETGEITNYYRITVGGSTLGGDARYVSGYFDAGAVEAYFGEFAQPDKATFLDHEDDPEQKESGDAKLEPVDPSKRGRQLVMLMSSNSDAVAESLGAIAQSEELTESIATLVARDTLVAARDAAAASAAQRSRFAYITALGTQAFRSLRPSDDAEGEPPSPAAVRVRLLPVINAFARELGAAEDFATFAEAKVWVDRASALQSGGRP
jgi:hypothetical protein